MVVILSSQKNLRKGIQTRLVYGGGSYKVQCSQGDIALDLDVGANLMKGHYVAALAHKASGFVQGVLPGSFLKRREEHFDLFLYGDRTRETTTDGRYTLSDRVRDAGSNRMGSTQQGRQFLEQKTGRRKRRELYSLLDKAYSQGLDFDTRDILMLIQQGKLGFGAVGAGLEAIAANSSLKQIKGVVPERMNERYNFVARREGFSRYVTTPLSDGLARKIDFGRLLGDIELDLNAINDSRHVYLTIERTLKVESSFRAISLNMNRNQQEVVARAQTFLKMGLLYFFVDTQDSYEHVPRSLEKIQNEFSVAERIRSRAGPFVPPNQRGEQTRPDRPNTNGQKYTRTTQEAALPAGALEEDNVDRKPDLEEVRDLVETYNTDDKDGRHDDVNTLLQEFLEMDLGS